jgi:hypothetical protein
MNTASWYKITANFPFDINLHFKLKLWIGLLVACWTCEYFFGRSCFLLGPMCEGGFVFVAFLLTIYLVFYELSSLKQFLFRLGLVLAVFFLWVSPIWLFGGFRHLGYLHHIQSIATPGLREELKAIVAAKITDMEQRKEPRDKLQEMNQFGEHGFLTQGELPIALTNSNWGLPRVTVNRQKGRSPIIQASWGGSWSGHHGFMMTDEAPKPSGGYGGGMMTGDNGETITFVPTDSYLHWVDDCYYTFDDD